MHNLSLKGKNMAQIVTILYICKSSRDVVYASSLICLHSQELIILQLLYWRHLLVFKKISLYNLYTCMLHKNYVHL